uniref:Uncharacterized protein n=1 Tax=viral metagenome TaxID=1070528 RepID=A0A6C0E7M8_9ZZZZ
MSKTFLGNLGGQIQKKFYVYFIKKILGSWIKNPPHIDDVDVLEHELNLSYLEFEHSLIDQHIQQYPFKVLSAYLKDLKIPSVTWTNITNLRTYFSIGKLVLVLLIEEPTPHPPNMFLKLKENIHQIEQDFTESIYNNTNQNTHSDKGIKSIAKIIRDTLYNLKFQIDMIEIQLKSDTHQDNPLIIQFKDININQQSIINPEEDEAWKYLKFNINVLIDSKIIFENIDSQITLNYEINKGKLSVDIPKIKGDINASHLEKILDLMGLYQEFSKFQNQSQMSFGMYFCSENDLRSFIDIETEDTIDDFFKLFQEKIEIIEIDSFELKIISNNPSNYLLITLDTFKLKDPLLNNTFNLNIKEITPSKTSIILSNPDLFDFSIRPSTQNQKHYKLHIDTRNTTINFDIDIINRYTSYFSIKYVGGTYDIDPDPIKFYLNIKLNDVKINIFVPEENNYLQIKTNVLAVKFDPCEVKFDNFELCLVVGENEPKTIYISDFLRLAIQKKTFDNSNQIRSHPTLFSDDPILIDQYGLYYQPTDQAGFQNFNSIIYPRVSTRVVILFGKTHLLIKEKNILTHLNQLIKSVSNLKLELPPPIRSEYTVIDMKWKEFFIILEDKFIVKLLCFSLQSVINFYTDQTFHYFRLEDGCIYNSKTEEVVLEKVDHRNTFMFVAAIQTDLFPINNNINTIKNKISKVALLFESVRIHHFLNNKFWILEIIDYFKNTETNVETNVATNVETNVNTDQIIYVSSKKLDLNLIINKDYNLTFSGSGVKMSFKSNLELVVFDHLSINIFNQIITIPILKVNHINYYLSCSGNSNSLSASSSSELNLDCPYIAIDNIDFTICADSLEITEKIIKIISDNQSDHEKYPIQTVVDIDIDERNEIKMLMMDALLSDNYQPQEPIILEKSYNKLNNSELLEFVPVDLSSKKKLELPISIINQLRLEINRTRFLIYSGSDLTHQRNCNIYLELSLDGIKIIKMKMPDRDNFIEIELALTDAKLIGVLDEKQHKIFFQKMPHITKRLTSYNSTRSYFNASKSQPFHIHFRKDLTEYYIEMSFFPARLDINQNLINFILEFIQNYTNYASLEAIDNEDEKRVEDKIHFKSIKMNQMYFRVNYASNLFDCKFKNHHWILNFLSLRKLDLMFNEYYIDNVYGVPNVIKHLSDHYLEVLSQQKQIKIIKSITPLRSIIRLANGIVNLVIIPSKECYQTGKVIKGLKNGLTNFKETTLDELRAIGHKTFDIISNTIEVFEPNNSNTSNVQDAVIEIPYRDYNQKGIMRAIQSYLQSS